MDEISGFGLAAVTMMLAGLVFERRSHWFTLTLAVGCAIASASALLLHVWVIGVLAFAGYLAEMVRWVERADDEEVVT